MAAARQKEMKESITDVATITFVRPAGFSMCVAMCAFPVLNSKFTHRGMLSRTRRRARGHLPRALYKRGRKRSPFPLAYEVSCRAWTEEVSDACVLKSRPHTPAIRPVSRTSGGTLVPPRRLHTPKTSAAADDSGSQFTNIRMDRRLPYESRKASLRIPKCLPL